MAVCRECIQAIKFIVTNNGHRMPVNSTPVEVVLFEGKDKFVVDGEVKLGRLARPGEKSKTAYVPHWATCTAPDKFRKKEVEEKIKEQPKLSDLKNSAKLFMMMQTIR